MPFNNKGDEANTRSTVDGPLAENAPTISEPPCPLDRDCGGVSRDSVALLLVGHGSRRASGTSEFEQFVAAFAEREQLHRVAFGYLELSKPSLDEAIDAIAEEVGHVVLVPVFLFLAGHVKNDLPLALERARERHPRVGFSAARPLGVDAALCDLAWQRFENALNSDTTRRVQLDKTACLLIGRGSSDPDANADFFKAARFISEGRGLLRMEPCFLGIAQPDVASGLELLSRLRPATIIVSPYILFAGRLLERLTATVDEFRKSHPWIRVEIAHHLDSHEAVLRTVADRAQSAIEGRDVLPCDTCQYREPLPGRAREAGGMRALLWSLRHGFTHAQAMPAEHAHPAVTKHVFVCGNVDCSERGSIPLLRGLRSEIKKAGLSRTVRVTKTACMGRCGEGPSVAVYPDGIWYRQVSEQDAAELVSEHFIADRIVGRLVDNILQ